MIPFGTETVTLYRRTEKVVSGRTQAVYTRHILTGCSWRYSNTRHFDGTTEVFSGSWSCRIPPGGIRPNEGDLLVHGVCAQEAENSKDIETILQTHRETGAFLVRSAGDFTGPGVPIPHYAAKG